MPHYIEKEWTTAAGLKAVVLMMTEKTKKEECLRHHRCGYVAVPEGYKAWGAKLFDPRFDVHGGVTFSEGIERTLGYCETECEYLARQIVELEEN